MKKTLIAVFLLLVMASYGKETSGQERERQPQNYFLPANAPSVSPTAETGSGGYLTHPEFSDIIITTIITPAKTPTMATSLLPPFPKISMAIRPS